MDALDIAILRVMGFEPYGRPPQDPDALKPGTIAHAVGVRAETVRERVQRLEADGVPCYLETFQPRNLPLYRRHGFEVAIEVDPPGGAPHMWGMLRPARTPDGRVGDGRR